MAVATHSSKLNIHSLPKYKEKENQKPPASIFNSLLPKNTESNGTVPKRYRSVYTEGTPLTSLGVRNDDSQPRSHSPPNHISAQHHQRPLKPVKEFLTTYPSVDQQSNIRSQSHSQTNFYSRTQTDATIQNVNIALTKSLNKLRQEPVNAVTMNGHSTPLYVEQVPSRPTTARVTSHKNAATVTAANYYYQLPVGMKGGLPTELMSRRPTSSLITNKPPNTTSTSRISYGTGPLSVPQPPASIHNEIKTNSSTSNIHVSTALRVPTKIMDAGVHQSDGLNLKTITIEEPKDKSKKSNKESCQQPTIKSTTGAESSTFRMRNIDNQQHSLPEVSVNPHIQSAIQKPNDQIMQSVEKNRTGDKHTNHHHIKVEPTDTKKRITSASSPLQSPSVIDVQPNTTVQFRSSKSETNSTENDLRSPVEDKLNEAYIERENRGAQVLTNEEPPTDNLNNNSSSTTIQSAYHYDKIRYSLTPPPSPATQELNNIWRKQNHNRSNTSTTAAQGGRQHPKYHRPACRLKNYEDESDSETTATGTQSKDEGMANVNGALPSDLGSEDWSDLTSEFSDTKLRKHRHVRTSTPNVTRHSSSLSSKEVGLIRKQLTDLQMMYNDLLKLLDIDIESVRSSLKSSTSSQADHHNRRHRFRKVMPIPSMRQNNFDMVEINQRFTRLEASLVTLAESIAKLSAQIQMQRVIKDDVQNLRREVAELRQQLHNQYTRQQSTMHTGPIGGSTSSAATTPHPPSRLISANVQRLAATNGATPLNFSASYMPSTSTIQRSNSIIDPRQARKIEQFFGTEAMLRYFLSLLNYEEYAPLLEREKIGIYELPYISERKLQSLGIPYGPCTRIIQEAQQYFISLLTLRSSGIDV